MIVRGDFIVAGCIRRLTRVGCKLIGTTYHLFVYSATRRTNVDTNLDNANVRSYLDQLIASIVTEPSTSDTEVPEHKLPGE